MTLSVYKGRCEAVNTALLAHASEHLPSLILDCANYANPHLLLSFEEDFDKIYVINIDLIYKLRDTLKNLKSISKSIGATNIIITTFTRLFDYDNEEENKEIFKHSWELISNLSKTHNILVGIQENTIHEDLAQQYCKIVEV
ncbi:MAG: hypothetical protein MAG795_00804 [Candidatus Woesearchaeota archaeon]|nr:hypothetical protein [Candidatus Woesearchaeota archaeon]